MHRQMSVSIVPLKTDMPSDTKPAVEFTFNRAAGRNSPALKAFRISDSAQTFEQRACSTISYQSGCADLITSGFVMKTFDKFPFGEVLCKIRSSIL